MAILAGDGLQTLAFEWISNPAVYGAPFRKNLPPMAWMSWPITPAILAWSAGRWTTSWRGKTKKPSLSKVLSIHRRKTGALLLSSVRLPAVFWRGLPRPKLKALTDYGWSAGLSFQIVDDILNEMETAKSLGKLRESDRIWGKIDSSGGDGVGRIEKRSRKADSKIHPSRQAFRRQGGKRSPFRTQIRHMAQRTN